MNFDLNVVVPVYNEEASIDRIYNTFVEYFNSSSSLPTTVLFVDDGSIDGSLSKIKQIAEQDSRFHYLSFSENQGLSAAIKAGIDYTTSSHVGYIDADLQTTPFDFERFTPYLEEYVAVVGYREKRKDTVSKRIQSKIANSIRRSLINDQIIDTGCPLKIIRTDVAKSIPFFHGMHRFIPALIQLQGNKVKQVPVQHFDRIEGESKFNLLNRSIGPLTDAFIYRWMKNRYIQYQVKEKKL